MKIYNTTSAAILGYRTPEQEQADRANHDYMKSLERNPPIVIGSDKQIAWAKTIAAQFLFYAHAWEFTKEQIDMVFASPQGRNAKFWIDNRASRSGSGETRIAVEELIARIEKAKENDARFAAQSEDMFRAKVRRL